MPLRNRNRNTIPNFRKVGGSGFTGLLDEYGGAAAAYSVRRLSSTYSGSLIEVRRSSDNTTQDIGYDDNGDLDTASLLSFVGVGDGFVRTWYDQSGNANDVQQTTTSNQPQIVSSGSLITKNSLSAIDFGTTSESLSFEITTDDFASSRPELYTVISIDNHDVSGTVYFGTTTNGLFWQQGPTINHFTQGGSIFQTEVVNDGLLRLYVEYPDATTKRVDINTNTYTSTSGTTLTASGSDTFVLGKWEGGTNWDLDGTIQEFIIYTTSQNRLGIKSNINSYFSIY